MHFQKSSKKKKKFCASLPGGAAATSSICTGEPYASQNRLTTGAGIGEICGLQWGDFDLKLGTLNINRTVCRISCGNCHTKVVIQTPKTRTSRREIPIPKQLLLMLKKLRGSASNAAWFLSGSESKPTEPRCYRKSIKGNHSNFSITQMEDTAFSIPLFLQKGTQLLYFMLKDPCLRKGRGPIFS